MTNTTAAATGMADAPPTRIYLFKRFERFWHWSQALMIIIMFITGFEIHGTYAWLGFAQAVNVHTLAAWALLALWAFTIFWQFTTGEWRQYLPTLKKADKMVVYYLWGIFHNAPNPFKKTQVSKHNPLQRLAYLALLAAVSPLIWGSGLLYLFRAYWPSAGVDTWLSLQWVAYAHTAGAFMMLVFFFVHVYLTTTGHTPTAHIKTMITGWEEVEPDHHP
ncbi:cytochrome b/b6 domain-containing protein [Rhodoferax antarcticus]|uniref:Cytochrome b561 n=1 Tax=Rhodoferax antarcticus ANT.BR TaxID=1111071 RepID=A0A1Q8YHU6_9BURK|nr:cytochrome b/b6 domain-containing protein [Rhodoferax antarcticus]MCW2311026.1 thiosulfate reductase cytochrome b subunit [Rhodoferax antarcticus]OLP07543.1 cytochrome b561 [Rhodoferax antarcticus ANT.BR]